MGRNTTYLLCKEVVLLVNDHCLLKGQKEVACGHNDLFVARYATFRNVHQLWTSGHSNSASHIFTCGVVLSWQQKASPKSIDGFWKWWKDSSFLVRFQGEGNVRFKIMVHWISPGKLTSVAPYVGFCFFFLENVSVNANRNVRFTMGRQTFRLAVTQNTRFVAWCCTQNVSWKL